MDKGLFFIILGLGSLWLVLDEFVGGKRLTTIAGLMTPNLPSIGDVVKDAVKDKVHDAGEVLGEKAPSIFFNPKDKEDIKKKDDRDSAIMDYIEKNNPNTIY